MYLKRSIGICAVIPVAMYPRMAAGTGRSVPAPIQAVFIFLPLLAPDTGAGTLLVLVEQISSGWFQFAWNRDVQKDEVGRLLFEGGTPSGVDITKGASGAFLVSGMTNEMLYDYRRREIVPLSGFMKVSKVLIIKTMVERR